MATLAAKAALKSMNPRSPDTKYVGNEPEWRVQPEQDRNRISAMSHAFGWYNYFYGKKEAKEMIVAYLDAHKRVKDAKKIRTLPDSQVRLTTGWLCRMSMMGLELTDQEQIKLDNLIADLLAIKDQAAAEVAEPEAVAKPNIQDRLKEKMKDCAGELEGMFDDFVAAGCKMSADWKPIAQIRGMNVAPQMVYHIADIWKTRLAHFELVVAGKDSQLVEGYSYLSKIQLRNIVKFCESVISDCGAYVQIKKVERKPRKVKPVSPEKKAAKFKHQVEFAELKLKGLPAASLVDKSEAWLYDTKKRKLIHVVADSHAGSFTIKSSSIIGFSVSETQQKTVRKPAETIKAIQAAGKPAARKIFKDLTTTETQFNGRSSENLLVLKSW
jgi:hypothetical protein